MQYTYYSFRINTLELTNFRKFETLDITFDESITALTAPNGGGKSAVMQALAVACSHFISSIGAYPGAGTGIDEDDHRLIRQLGGGMAPAPGDAVIKCSGEVCNRAIEWSRERTFRTNAKTRISNAVALQRAALELRDASSRADLRLSETYPVAPVLAYYDTKRLNRELRLTEKRKVQRRDRFEGYDDCLSSGSYILVFKNWFRDLSFELWQKSENTEEHRLYTTQLSIVRGAVDRALRHVGWGNLQWSRTKNTLTLEHPVHGVLCFDQLSDGIKNVLNLVADIAHRAVKLNPAAGPDLLDHVCGLVLIDEIDMYLHPGWQQRVVSVFREIFPRVHFVITTHSPQVLSTLRKEQIRILTEDEEGRCLAFSPPDSPYARSSAEALGLIFDVNPVPEVSETDEIRRLQQLYRGGKTAEADALRRELEDKGIEFAESDVKFWKFLAKF